jgi:hypothetical protein
VIHYMRLYDIDLADNTDASKILNIASGGIYFKRTHATFVIFIYFLKLFFIQNHRTNIYSLRKKSDFITCALAKITWWRIWVFIPWKYIQNCIHWAKNIHVYFFDCRCFENSTAIYNKIPKFSTLNTRI